MNVKQLGVAMALVAGLGMNGAAYSNGILAGNGVGASVETAVTGGVVDGYMQWTINASVAYSPEAGPWKKVLSYENQGGGVVDGFKLHETITNASQLAWTDWHEEVLTTGWSWERFRVDGPDFVLSGLPFSGTTILDIYFPLPVLPGQTITIEKLLQPAAGASIPIEVRQYPTVPEPATLALVGLGLAGLGFSRRRAH